MSYLLEYNGINGEPKDKDRLTRLKLHSLDEGLKLNGVIS